MTRTLAKICSVVPFAVYGVLLLVLELAVLFPSSSDFELTLPEGLLFVALLFGWIPSLASATAGVVFSLLSRKARHGTMFLAFSCVHLAVGIAWGAGAMLVLIP